MLCNFTPDAMELLEKLFTKRKLDDNNHESRDRARSSQITEEQVRLLLFRESDWRGRKVLFDSSTIERVFSGKNDRPISKQNELPCILEVSEGFSYVYKGPASDTSILGEMIFGAVSLSYKGASMKIHLMEEPRRLMCSKVFCVPISRRSRTDRNSCKGNSGGELHNTSKPLIVPPQREDGASLSFSFNRGDSGYCEEQTPYSSYGSTNDYFSMLDTWDGGPSDEYSFNSPSGRKLSISSNGSWQRRTFRSMATRFDLSQSTNSLTVPYANSYNSDPQMCSNSTASTSDSFASVGSVASQRRNKLGIALLITVTEHTDTDLVEKCSELCSQLQAIVCRLRLAALAGATTTDRFISTLYRATTEAAKWLSDLLYGPRTPSMWLNLVTSEQHRTGNKLAESLLADICFVLSVGDTKNTKFFLSTLITYVLTYHLGWVSTVSPYESEGPPRAYNALWAQLNDLTGSIGYPPTIARTIVCGTANKFINRLLVVLTYFIRCGDIRTSNFQYKDCAVSEKVIDVDCGETVTKSEQSRLAVNTQVGSGSTLSSEASIRRLPTFLNKSDTLSNMDLYRDCGSSETATSTGGLKRNQTLLIPQNYSDSSEESSLSEEMETRQKVIFVLGDNEKLVGLKNKSNGGKSVKRSSKSNEPLVSEVSEKLDIVPKVSDHRNHTRHSESPSKCCSQTLQHSKPIKHSGFKFEFDKYPQIVTNYMKSKNLEILDRHYIGKPGNLKLDNFQFDPTVVPPIQEERCETCYKCQLMESMLQTPTNASELEYMNDVPRQSEPQFAKESVVKNVDSAQISPKTFIRKRKENTIIVNVIPPKPEITVEVSEKSEEDKKRVRRVIEFPMWECVDSRSPLRAGFDASLLGAVTDHYVPDLVLQGTTAQPSTWEMQLQRDLELTMYLNKTSEEPIQAVGIIGDTNTWEVRIVSREHAASGMSALVAAMLEVLPAMWRAKVPAHQCLSFLEGKLRELCELSKTLADMLMSTDFCDIATLTKSLNIDVNDVPLLLAVATTHTPQVAKRYGISYR